MPGKLISKIIFFQDIWRRLHFSARKIYRESFSLVKLELLSTCARIHIKLPRSQITRPSQKIGHKCWFCMLSLISDQGSLATVWNHGCVKQGSVDDWYTLVYWFWGCVSYFGQVIMFLGTRSSSLLRVIAGSQQFEWHLPFEDTPEMHDMNFPCRHKWTSLKKKHSNVGHHKKRGRNYLGWKLQQSLLARFLAKVHSAPEEIFVSH